MSGPDAGELLYGCREALPEGVPLRAGPLTLVFEAGDLRDIRYGDDEIVRRIYGAVRDRHWGTVPGRLDRLRILQRDQGFRITYGSEHRQGDVDFSWEATIEGTAEAALTFAFSGQANATFLKNRIGLCVLHPLPLCAGRAATAHRGDGTLRPVRFPGLVAQEQPVEGFDDLTGLDYEVRPGISLQLRLAGDLFQMEDQRNWIDASFKTYSTPLSRPWPAEIAAGTRVEQCVTLKLLGAQSGAPCVQRRGRGTPVDVGLAGAPPQRLPAIGIPLASAAGGLSGAQATRLRGGRPGHVRVDLPLGAEWRPALDAALACARTFACRLELALDVPDRASAPLLELARRLPSDGSIARILVFTAGRAVTSPATLEEVRTHLLDARQDLNRLGTGSRADLYELNLTPAPHADIVCWSMNPQAHASDIRSIAETPCAAGAQVRSVAQYYPQQSRAVSPVTLRPREHAGDPHGTNLQGSLFCAAWTLAVLKYLAEARTESVTFFETAEDLGPEHGVAGFPVFHLLAQAAGCAGGTVVPTTAGQETVASLLLRHPGGDSLFLASLAPHAQLVRIPREFGPGTVRVLDLESIRSSMDHPDGFRPVGRIPAMEAMPLPPFSVARVDGHLTPFAWPHRHS